jgi:hypothetical protein
MPGPSDWTDPGTVTVDPGAVTVDPVDRGVASGP